MTGRRGFTMLEILLVLAIGAVLVSIAWSAAGQARAGYAVRSARTAFGSLSARARATAVERGRTIYFEADQAGDSAWIRDGTEILETLRLGGLGNVEIDASFQQCFGPRGLAMPPCGTVAVPLEIRFRRGSRWAGGQLLPMGQFVEGAQGT